MSKRANTCRTCKHLLRQTYGMDCSPDYLCEHPERKRGVLYQWRTQNKNNYNLPNNGARNCPGYTAKEAK